MIVPMTIVPTIENNITQTKILVIFLVVFVCLVLSLFAMTLFAYFHLAHLLYCTLKEDDLSSFFRNNYSFLKSMLL